MPYTPEKWRRGLDLPEKAQQGIVVGCSYAPSGATALVDTDDVHALMIGASGIGKTAFFLYPNLEYACACGMSFLTSDTKGDLFHHYGKIAKDYYGYHVAVIDLRNPTKSDGNNLLHLVNKYMDLWRAEPERIAYKAKAEKYAKIIAKTIISSMQHRRHHPVLCAVDEKLRSRGRGDHHRQHPADHFRRFRTQQQIRRAALAGTRQADGAVGLG